MGACGGSPDTGAVLRLDAGTEMRQSGRMIRARIFGALLALGLFTGAAMPPHAGETITIRHRFKRVAGSSS